MKTNEEFNEHLRTALGIISGRIDISQHYNLDLLDRMGCYAREATAEHVLEKLRKFYTKHFAGKKARNWPNKNPEKT